MKCVECKLAKFDGKNWTCPAYPYAQIDMYTENPECSASAWYPNCVRDRIECEQVRYQNYETYSLVLGRAIEDCIKYHLPERLRAELEALYSRAQLNMHSSAIEFEKLQNEIDRLKMNGLA